jgi:hypothetical protein
MAIPPTPLATLDSTIGEIPTRPLHRLSASTTCLPVRRRSSASRLDSPVRHPDSTSRVRLAPVTSAAHPTTRAQIASPPRSFRQIQSRDDQSNPILVSSPRKTYLNKQKLATKDPFDLLPNTARGALPYISKPTCSPTDPATRITALR